MYIGTYKISVILILIIAVVYDYQKAELNVCFDKIKLMCYYLFIIILSWMKNPQNANCTLL